MAKDAKTIKNKYAKIFIVIGILVVYVLEPIRENIA